jgi:hypothetical protein
MGNDDDDARPLATLNPTRRALKAPGPKATAIPWRSPAVNPRSPRTCATAGISSEVWFTLEYQVRHETTRSSSARATPANLVEVSMANSI